MFINFVNYSELGKFKQFRDSDNIESTMVSNFLIYTKQSFNSYLEKTFFTFFLVLITNRLGKKTYQLTLLF